MVCLLPNPRAVFEVVADAFRDHARAEIRRRDRFTAALTGGRLAGQWYEAISRREWIDWAKVDLYWGDERAVPPDHEDSNARLAAPLIACGARAHRMMGEAEDLEAAAAAYASILPPVLDLVHLGVGADGHVCSLFPGHPLLAEERRRVAAVFDSPKPPPRRLTVTLPTLRNARAIHVIAVGEEKAEAVGAAVTGDDPRLPAVLVSKGPADVTWFVDRAAASVLKGRL
jgi:6-phosphogluconolactonase